MSSGELEAFIAALPAAEATIARGDPDLGAALDEAIERGKAAHPQIALSPAVLASYLANHADDTHVPSVWIPKRNLQDLHLACAVFHGVTAAVAQFERTIVPHMRIAAH